MASAQRPGERRLWRSMIPEALLEVIRCVLAKSNACSWRRNIEHWNTQREAGVHVATALPIGTRNLRNRCHPANYKDSKKPASNDLGKS
jgi:hypothetical protein